MAKIKKKLLFAAWGCHNKKWHTYQLFDSVLRRIFSEVVTFDPQEEVYQNGKDNMNAKFLDLVKKERPDYIFYWFMHEEFYIKTLVKVNEITPHAITLCYNGDDDYKFENYTISFFPLIDYFLITQPDYVVRANNLGKKTFSACGADTKEFHPKNVKKEYDVSFVGTPKNDRVDYMKYLIENNINVKVFGAGWEKYQEFNNAHLGEITGEEFIDVINKSKINICLSKNYLGGTHILERFFEINACKSLCLTEYTKGYFPEFKEGKDIITFKNKEELLDKIKIFLKDDKLREKIVTAAYKKTLANHDNEKILRNAINYMEKNRKIKKDYLPKINKSFTYIELSELKKGKNFLTKKLESYDYVFFKRNNFQPLDFREYLTIHSAELLKKEIVVNDVYYSSFFVKDYAWLALQYVYDLPNKDLFYDNLDIAQVMVSKNYLLNNLDNLSKTIDSGKLSFVNKDNSAFISIPLLRTTKITKLPVKKSEHILFPQFERDLVTLKNQGKLKKSVYPYKLLLFTSLFHRDLFSFIIQETIKRSKNKKLIAISNRLKRDN